MMDNQTNRKERSGKKGMSSDGMWRPNMGSFQ